MIAPGPRNSLTDIAGLRVGNAEDKVARTGVTVVLPERPVLAAVDVRGGSPFTVNTATLDPSSIVKSLHGLVLSGGSAFGLEAAGGLTSWLAVRGVGAVIGPDSIPTVAGAILYDLANGGEDPSALAVQRIDANGVVRGETYRETSRATVSGTEGPPGAADGGGVLLVQVDAVPALVDVSPGSWYVPLDQPLADLAVAALEPDTPSSYLANGVVSGVGGVARVLARPAFRSSPVP